MKEQQERSHERSSNQTVKTISLPKHMAKFLEEESRRIGVNNVSGLVRMVLAQYIDAQGRKTLKR
jgi:hypothetical protein